MTIIVMIDTETTSLTPETGGCVHQIGILAQEVATNKTATTIIEQCFYLPTLESHWNAVTLAWAKNHIPDAVQETLVSNMTYPAVENERQQTLSVVEATLRELKNHKQPIKVIFQHPEFDLPFLEEAGIDVRTILGYRNVHDLGSLILGYYAGRFPDTNSERMVEALYKRTVGNHTALGDCRAQMQRLSLIDYAGLHLSRS